MSNRTITCDMCGKQVMEISGDWANCLTCGDNLCVLCGDAASHTCTKDIDSHGGMSESRCTSTHSNLTALRISVAWILQNFSRRSAAGPSLCATPRA